MGILNDYRKNGEIDVADLIINERDALFGLLTKHNFLPIFAPALIEYLDANDILDETSINIKALKQIDWERKCGDNRNPEQSGQSDESRIDFDDPGKSLTIPAIDDAMEELGKAIAKSQLISQLGQACLRRIKQSLNGIRHQRRSRHDRFD